MKITKVSIKNGEMRQPTSVELDAIVEKMKSMPTTGRRTKSLLMFGATFGRGGFDSVTRRNNLLLLTTAEDTEQRTSHYQRQAMDVPYTVLSFRSSDRRRLNIVVSVARAAGKAAEGLSAGHQVACGEADGDAASHLQLLREAQQKVALVYESLVGCRIEQQDLTLETACPLCYDPLTLYRADAQAFPVIVKPSDPLADYRQARVGDDGAADPSAELAELERRRLEYFTCVQKVQEELPDDADDEQLLLRLAEQCRLSRLEEEPAVCRTLQLPQLGGAPEDLVRKIFRTVYARRTRSKGLSAMNQKERIARAIRDFFDRRYHLRYNVVKQQTEFRPNNHRPNPWRPLTDRDLRRIAFEEMLEGGHAWLMDIELYVNSSLVPRYHPVLAFLGGVGQWDRKHDYIGDYARRLKTDYEQWPHFFHRWLLAMVAQAMGKSRDYGNSMVPLLIGAQAMKKSTFCKNILPPAMREYYMDDIKMDNSEQVERVMGRMWLVNIDEYNAKTEREQAKIKRLLTEKDVQVRRMRTDEYIMTPRLCSFIATTNDRHPLTDPTGSRRYLCVEMTGQADMSGSVNYRQMYAQAVWEIEHGAQYWFDNDDEREITAHNQAYSLRTPLEEVLTSFYQPAAPQKEHFLTATVIQQQLMRRLRPADVPPLRKLGLALKRLRYPEGSHGGQHGYYLSMRREE